MMAQKRRAPSRISHTLEMKTVSTYEKFSEMTWEPVCNAEELLPNIGVRALIRGEQVALFRVQDKLYGISAIDPFCKAAVLSRGLVGDLKGRIVVASPVYKQHFDLETGECLEEQAAMLKTYMVRENGGRIEVAAC